MPVTLSWKRFLSSYGTDTERATPGHRMRPYLDALLNAGAMAQSSMIELLSLAFYWQCEERMPSAAEMDMQLAYRLLQHKRGGGKRNGLRRKVVCGLGYQLRSFLVPLLFEIHAHWKKSMAANEARRKETLTFAPTY